MPIAQCFLAPSCPEPQGQHLVSAWAQYSGQPQAEAEMSVNLSRVDQQWGKGYLIMAQLWLPSLWSEPAIAQLAQGLSLALGQHFALPQWEVLVLVQLLESGRVVEKGQLQCW
ncbi:hypothetical protein [Balneatrix alpica]|uniref:hypothetical protein n=1 Tax=Balneatrix alpica TaxID=75684 RepID=UPI00273960E4|nr:hypothetical protein [Balneatrix alpica]